MFLVFDYAFPDEGVNARVQLCQQKSHWTWVFWKPHLWLRLTWRSNMQAYFPLLGNLIGKMAFPRLSLAYVKDCHSPKTDLQQGWGKHGHRFLVPWRNRMHNMHSLVGFVGDGSATSFTKSWQLLPSPTLKWQSRRVHDSSAASEMCAVHLHGTFSGGVAWNDCCQAGTFIYTLVCRPCRVLLSRRLSSSCDSPWVHQWTSLLLSDGDSWDGCWMTRVAYFEISSFQSYWKCPRLWGTTQELVGNVPRGSRWSSIGIPAVTCGCTWVA